MNKKVIIGLILVVVAFIIYKKFSKKDETENSQTKRVAKENEPIKERIRPILKKQPTISDKFRGKLIKKSFSNDENI